MPSSTVSDVAGGEGHSPRPEAQGIFSLKINADDGVGYAVRACDETDPSGRNRGVLLDA